MRILSTRFVHGRCRAANAMQAPLETFKINGLVQQPEMHQQHHMRCGAQCWPQKPSLYNSRVAFAITPLGALNIQLIVSAKQPTRPCTWR